MDSIDELMKSLEIDIETNVSDIEEIESDSKKNNDIHESDANSDDFYIPESADFVLGNVMESNSDVWKEKHNQYREVIDQLGELKNKAAKYKKLTWKLKQKQLSLESQIAVQKNQMKIYEDQVELLQKDKEEILVLKRKSEEGFSNLENDIISLKTMISDKNREIANLEKQLAIANRKVILASSSIEDEERVTTLSNRVSELEAQLARQNSSIEQDEESRIESLENFVSLVRSLATVQSREDALQLSLTNNTCFHCGRYLSECSGDRDEPGCNYCSILTNLLQETPVQGKVAKVDGTVIVLIIFVLLSIALAIVAYNWRSEALSLALDVKQKVGNYI